MYSRTPTSAFRRAMLPVLLWLCSATISWGAVAEATNPTLKTQSNRLHKGSGAVIVRPKLGGQILGYDIDRTGSEGLLSEYVSLGDGNNDVATETFDQTTGEIVKVVAKKTNTQNDYVTEGIWGGIGIDLVQRVIQNRVHNHFSIVDPLSSGKFAGRWVPPLKKGYQLYAISVSPEGTGDVAAYQVIFDGSYRGFIFSANIATNTFGPRIPLQLGDLPVLAYDSKANHAVLGYTASPSTHPLLQTVDLTTGKIRQFNVLGVDNINAVAVDSATGTACVTTEGGPFVPPMVEFYDLAQQTGFGVTLSGSNIGLDVEFDSTNKLFLVAETDFVNSNVLVYDEKGSLQETIPVQKLPVSPSVIALNPGKRVGFLPVIVEPQHEFLELQSFAY